MRQRGRDQGGSQQGGHPEIKSSTKVACLQQAASYPQPSGRIESLETHFSWVFLTESHAYKLKKPVRYPFLDLTTLEARYRNCIEEIRLNRRLAPNVYEGLSSLTLDERGQLHLDGDGDPVEWLVRMRRLPAERMLDYRIRKRSLPLSRVRSLARLLARFYQGAPVVKVGGEAYGQRLADRIEGYRRVLATPSSGLSRSLVERVYEAQLEFMRREASLLQARATGGRIVEGHGDLRPEHICLEERPVIFDCLEFSRRLRIVDPVDELASLAMACERIGAPEVGPVLFHTYGAVTADIPPLRLIDFYKGYRACLWAKLASWRLEGAGRAHRSKWRERAEAYLRLAERYGSAALQPGRYPEEPR